MNNLTPSIAAALDSLSPRLAVALTDAGTSLSEMIDDIITSINSGNFSITATAAEVDAVAKDGAAFAYDADNTTGLVFGYGAGRICWGQTITEYSGGTITLSASATNYVEATPAGTVVKNTSGWTSGYMPLFTAYTSASAITSFLRMRPVMSMIPANGITGALLSTAAKTIQKVLVPGTLSATGSIVIPAPPFAATLTAVRLIVTTTVAANDTDYWTATMINKTSSGSGTTAMLSTADANTTKATGGTGLTNYVVRNLTLHGTPANLVNAANDVLVLTLTKSASAANLVGLVVEVEWTFAG